jgi:hypothetical protein
MQKGWATQKLLADLRIGDPPTSLPTFPLTRYGDG